MHLGYTTNEYGTRVSQHRCDACGSEFTVCPAAFPEAVGWNNCLAPTCPSYDPNRDVDKVLDEGKAEIVQAPAVGRA